MRDIVVVGSLNVDVSLGAERLPRPGETVAASELVLGPGGKGLNQAIGCARLGGRVHLVGRLGKDVLATLIRDALDQTHIDTTYVLAVPELPTGAAAIIVDRNTGENQIAVAAGANAAFAVNDVTDAIAAFRASGVLLVQLEVPLESVEAALDQAQELGLRTVLDPAPARPLTDAFLRKVDVLTPNESELEALTGQPVHDVESAARAGARLRERSQGDVIVTLGSAGCVWVSSTGFEHVPAPRVDPVDTTGAGDAFNAGLAVELARGAPIARSLRRAVLAGAAATLARGAAMAMPCEADLARLEL